MDSGLVLGATYTVYEVRDVFGMHLVKLRNPPDYGEEGSMEWNGDWSDESELWTAKIKNRLKHTNDSDDGTFWMSFDDLCTSFRCLYVCHWYVLMIFVQFSLVYKKTFFIDLKKYNTF